MVLQGSGNDLAGRSRAAVHEDHHRQPGIPVGPARVIGHVLSPLPTPGFHDGQALVQEHVGDGDSLVE